MKPYHKINSIFKRDPKTFKFIEGEYSTPEIAYLAKAQWMFTEKIDGTNIRVMWDMEKVSFGGRTERAQIPANLYDKLQEMFPVEKFKALYPDQPMCLYGEGYGAKIQKGGGNYIPDGVSFILFDVMVGDWMLRQADVTDVSCAMGVIAVPGLGMGTLQDAIDLVKGNLRSFIGTAQAEGVVMRPLVELQTRHGHRIITKVKVKDYV